MPGPATWKVVYSSLASSSLTALAKAKRNCSKVSATARPRLAGLLSTGNPAFSTEYGSGSTPRNGAGSMATEAADRPRPANICVNSPPNEWPITAGFFFSLPITPARWSATWPMDLRANSSGCTLASATVAGSSGHPGATGAKPACSKTVAQRSQLFGSNQRPWMKTTGVRPEPLAFSTWSAVAVAAEVAISFLPPRGHDRCLSAKYYRGAIDKLDDGLLGPCRGS